METQLTFFPVGNGAMALVTLPGNVNILIDVDIRELAKDDDNNERDVWEDLKRALPKDSNERRYVDAFLLSHPDEDHCRGLKNHFHLGTPKDSTGDKIFIREIWSSPIIFSRYLKALEDGDSLCEDAEAFVAEAKRRVQKFKDLGKPGPDGDRILVLGEDDDGKTDKLTAIVLKPGQATDKVNGTAIKGFSARLLAPLPNDRYEDDEELDKNDSSVVMQFVLPGDGAAKGLFLTGGDAGVKVWEALWKEYGKTERLKYDIAQTPHHTSWHAFSDDSWEEKGRKGAVNADAKKALGQAQEGASIVSSSIPVKADDENPPCIGAKEIFEGILKPVAGEFHCTGEYPSEKNPAPLRFKIGKDGPVLLAAAAAEVYSSQTQGSKAPYVHG